MEATVMSSIAKRGSAHSMNPTTTEHDFRFPRRPLDPRPAQAKIDGSSPPGNSRTGAGHLRADLRALKLDLSASYAQDQDDVRSAVFPPFQDDIFRDNSDQSPEELQKQDPLAAQVWRYFSKTKQMLPKQERMENLTWRMMHMNLRKHERRQREQHMQQEQQARYVPSLRYFLSIDVCPCLYLSLTHSACVCMCVCVCGCGCQMSIAMRIVSSSSFPKRQRAVADLRPLSSTQQQSRQSAGASLNVPSGIAQLRKTSEQNIPQTESMNLDEFLVTDNVAATPAGIAFNQSQDALHHADEQSRQNATSAIPIKSRKESAQHFVPQSVPAQRVQDEFGYVTRHPRKTSIDERRVRDLSSPQLYAPHGGGGTEHLLLRCCSITDKPASV